MGNGKSKKKNLKIVNVLPINTRKEKLININEQQSVCKMLKLPFGLSLMKRKDAEERVHT